MNADHPVLIVGGGLSGLAVADGLRQAGIPFELLEGRRRYGGRAFSRSSEAGGRFDLGPAWIWPHNRRMRALAEDLSVPVFDQHAQGRLVFEDQQGMIRRDLDFAMMGGALRLEGGLGALIDALVARLDPARLHADHLVREIRTDTDRVTIRGDAATGPFECTGSHVIVAVPPRLLASTIAIDPAPDATTVARLSAIPTWMAGNAKLVAVYDHAFWRADGFSGDAVSHKGPLVEIHDASMSNGDQGALFGFVAPGLVSDILELQSAALTQLGALFGSQAERPETVLFKSWADDPLTATPSDRAPPTAHPVYGYPRGLERFGHGRFVLAGSEVADDEGGFLEGALVAAEAALDRILADPGVRRQA